MEKKDFQTNTFQRTEQFYDALWNTERTLFTNNEGTKETLRKFFNNQAGAGKNYAVGRITQINEKSIAYGDTYTTEEIFSYTDANHPNLVKESKKKGHNTDYLTETYTYDLGTTGKGRLTGISDATCNTSYSYNAAGELVSQAQRPSRGICEIRDHIAALTPGWRQADTAPSDKATRPDPTSTWFWVNQSPRPRTHWLTKGRSAFGLLRMPANRGTTNTNITSVASKPLPTSTIG